MLVLDAVFEDEDKLLINDSVRKAVFEAQELGPRSAGRAGQRAAITDEALADVLWKRLGPLVGSISSWFPDPPIYLPSPVDDWVAVRCNPRSRFYRYGLGGDFAPHQDEPWRPNESIISLLTVLVYLPAGGCQGGETVIDGEVVQVRDWRVAMFDHRLRHEGKPVEVGEKLVLRNDIVAHVVTICG